MQPAFRAAQRTETAVAERLYARGLSLPCSVGITPGERQHVVDALVRRLR
jgi:dTDP-4-amino-4,6-dideoxygalactose transaminase